jgi:multidrug efflux pump subunit AcrA (membrane-fusion protein)
MVVALPRPGDAEAARGVEAPIGALYDAGKGPGVWVIEPRTSTVQWRPVRVAALGGETVTISEGLNGGDRFVALGAHMLHQGQKVRVQTGAVQ